jgi:hypothetical protein
MPVSSAGEAGPDVSGEIVGAGASEGEGGSQHLALLLAMAMFVLVVDTSFMNVSISAR